MKYQLLMLVLAACGADETARAQPAPPAPATLTWRERVATEIATIDPLDQIKRDQSAAVVIDRLAKKTDPEEVRVQLAEQLPRWGGVYADAIADLFIEENSALVRAAFVRSARSAPTDQAVSILRRAFADSAIEVRIEAARVSAQHAAGTRLAGELRNALAAAEPALRAEAVRSLGALRVEAAKEELVKALRDTNAEVRLEALRAVDRIAPGTLAGSTAVITLQSDPDSRVAALAKQLAVRQ